jgi:hypothetical protein
MLRASSAGHASAELALNIQRYKRSEASRCCLLLFHHIRLPVQLRSTSVEGRATCVNLPAASRVARQLGMVSPPSVLCSVDVRISVQRAIYNNSLLSVLRKGFRMVTKYMYKMSVVVLRKLLFQFSMSEDSYTSDQEVTNMLSLPPDQDGNRDWEQRTQNYMLAKEYIKKYEVSCHCTFGFRVLTCSLGTPCCRISSQCWSICGRRKSTKFDRHSGAWSI